MDILNLINNAINFKDDDNEYITIAKLKEIFWNSYKKHKNDYKKIFKSFSFHFIFEKNFRMYRYCENGDKIVHLEFYRGSKFYKILLKNGVIQNEDLENDILLKLKSLEKEINEFFTNEAYDFIIDNHPIEIESNFGKFKMVCFHDYSYNYDYISLDFSFIESTNTNFREMYNPEVYHIAIGLKGYLLNRLKSQEISSSLKSQIRELIEGLDFNELFKIKINTLPKCVQNDIFNSNIKETKQFEIKLDDSLEKIITKMLSQGNYTRLNRIIYREDICEYVKYPTPHYEIKPLFRNNSVLRLLNLTQCSFDDVFIAGIDFSGTNAHFDPKKVYMRNLKNTNCENVVFDSYDFTNCILDGCKITFPNIVNLDNVKSYKDAKIEYYILNNEFFSYLNESQKAKKLVRKKNLRILR